MIFITGASGMVGSHLLDFLIKNTSYSIVLLMRHRSRFDNLEQHADLINNNERIYLHYGDLCDLASLVKVFSKFDISYVYHLAAQSFPQTSFVAPIETLTTNIIGTANLLEAIRLTSSTPKIHICSSSEVFGRVPKEQVPINENVSFHPASPYAISKAGTDLLGRYYGEAYGLKTVTTRMFTHTGPRRTDVFAESSFAKQIVLAEMGYIEPKIKVGNLRSLRTFADVRDAVRAYVMALEANLEPGSFYNIGGTHTCTIGEMLDYLISLSDVKEFEIVEDTSRLRPVDADLQVPDCRKFMSDTGWQPEVSFEETMLDLLNYWREQIGRSTARVVR